MKSKSRKKTSHFSMKWLLVGILLMVSVLAIGFAAFQAGVDIDAFTAVVRVQQDIRITNFSFQSATNQGGSSLEDYNVSNVLVDLDLPNASSTVSYNVEVTNLGNVNMALVQVSDLPSNLTYRFDGYTLNDPLCDDQDSTKCSLGAKTTLHFTILYANNGFDSNHTHYSMNAHFQFEAIDYVARIDNQPYQTLQEAIDAVPNDNTKTTVVLLKNTSETITVNQNKNVELDLQDKVLSNVGNTPVIENKGTITFLRGTIQSDASANGAVNNQSTGTFHMLGGSILVTGGRQALYNNKGTVTISGNSYLFSVSTIRAAVQNVSGGTMKIQSGTIVSTGFSALVNAGNLTIGEKDGDYHEDSPSFQGNDKGVSSTSNFNYYDGIIKGKNGAISDVSKVRELEDLYGIVYGTEVITGETYQTAKLGISKKVTFNPNGGYFDESTRYVLLNEEVGTLPVGVKSAHIFEGWFTALNGGEEINEHTIISDDVTFYAHFQKTKDVAKIGTTIYDTLQEAIDAAGNNNPTTIQLLKDICENVTVATRQNITFDFNGYSHSSCGNSPIIENSGDLSIISGDFLSVADYAAINQLAGTLKMSGGRVVATGTRQAIYITGGTTEISGNAYLSSTTSGVPNLTTMERGTIQCLNGGTIIVTGGTIVATKQNAISNEGILRIGVKDGSINTSTPVMIGNTYGVKNAATFYFYDGIMKGKTDAMDGSVTEVEDNSRIMNGMEMIDGETYKVQYLD